MKILILLIAAIISSTTFASLDTPIVCPSSIDEIVDLIQAPGTACYDATKIANECAFGSSGDIAIAGAAKVICLKEAGTLSTADKRLLATMEARCNQAYSGMEGTMYMSMNAFCHLEAVNFIRNVQHL